MAWHIKKYNSILLGTLNVILQPTTTLNLDTLLPDTHAEVQTSSMIAWKSLTKFIPAD